jgi:hypothetical protein
MPLGHQCTQLHPTAFPEFALHIWTKYLRMISLIFYNLQNTFKKICIFLRQVKLAIGWTEYQLNLY